MEPLSHSRQAFDRDLEQLEHDLLEMGSRAENMLTRAVDSLASLDIEGAMSVIGSDDDIDEREIQIENLCLRMLALQQPIASDLRVVGTALKMITDIERVGDLAVDIAKIALKIEKELGRTDIIDLRRMASEARVMLLEAMESYVKRDLSLVEKVCQRDDEVDDLYRELRAQIHEYMRSHPESVVSSSWLLLAIHHIERVADHAVNIAERVHFMVTGRFEALAGED